MGKYAKYHMKTPGKREMNPIWRGIGCLLIVIVPLISYGLMLVVTPAVIKTGLVPYQLQGYAHFPVWAFRYKMTSSIALFIGSFNNMWCSIIVFFVILLLLAGIISLIYTSLYQVVGPARYTPVDAPPTKYSGKRYKR